MDVEVKYFNFLFRIKTLIFLAIKRIITLNLVPESHPQLQRSLWAWLRSLLQLH